MPSVLRPSMRASSALISSSRPASTRAPSMCCTALQTLNDRISLSRLRSPLIGVPSILRSASSSVRFLSIIESSRVRFVFSSSKRCSCSGVRSALDGFSQMPRISFTIAFRLSRSSLMYLPVIVKMFCILAASGQPKNCIFFCCGQLKGESWPPLSLAHAGMGSVCEGLPELFPSTKRAGVAD